MENLTLKGSVNTIVSLTDTSGDSTETPKTSSKEHHCKEPGCDAVFTRPYRLNNHVLSQHYHKKQFACSYEDCDKSYTSQSHLRRHIEVIHLGESGNDQSVKCDFEGCGLVLSNKYSLKKHVKRAHTHLPFPCQICDKQFKRKTELNEHKIETHGCEAPYKCDRCPKAFVQYHLYHKHRVRHKRYICDCDRSFDKWTDYLKHKKTDCTVPKQDHVCPICSRKFNSKQNLRQHSINIHVADSQRVDYECPHSDCQRSYKYKNNLNVHIKMVHEEGATAQPLRCPKDDCTAVLKTTKNLKQHLRNCHRLKPLKEKLRRKPRKDRGTFKRSAASILSGLKVSPAEDRENIEKWSSNKTAESGENAAELEDGKLPTVTSVPSKSFTAGTNSWLKTTELVLNIG